MSRSIEIKRLSTGTVFKILIIGGLYSVIPFSVLMGILSLFGASTITWNHQHLTGLTGLIASPLIGAFVTLFLSGFFGIFIAAGLWLYSKFKPLTINYHQINENT